MSVLYLMFPLPEVLHNIQNYTHRGKKHFVLDLSINEGVKKIEFFIAISPKKCLIYYFHKWVEKYKYSLYISLCLIIYPMYFLSETNMYRTVNYV